MEWLLLSKKSMFLISFAIILLFKFFLSFIVIHENPKFLNHISNRMIGNASIINKK